LHIFINSLGFVKIVFIEIPVDRYLPFFYLCIARKRMFGGLKDKTDR